MAGFVEWVGERIFETDQLASGSGECGEGERSTLRAGSAGIGQRVRAIEMEVSLGLVLAGEVRPRWRKDA